jgi:hypothetical protein
MQIFSTGRSEPTPDEFWARKEEELGAAIRAYALGRYVNPPNSERGLWGIFYFTDEQFYFQHFAQTNWFRSILAAGDAAPAGTREMRVELPLAQVRSVEEPGRRGPIETLLIGPSRTCVLHTDSSEPDIRFTVEHRRREFVEELRSAVAAAGV